MSWGIKVFDELNRNIIDFIQPVYILDYFFISSNSAGTRNYKFDTQKFSLKWASSLGISSEYSTLNIITNDNQIFWSSNSYSFDIIVFLEVI